MVEPVRSTKRVPEGCVVLVLIGAFVALAIIGILSNNASELE
jgi:hypothetical protein